MGREALISANCLRSLRLSSLNGSSILNFITTIDRINTDGTYFNQLLVIIQTYERMPTRPELSKLNKTMVNNMTNYLSSISGAINKLIDFILN